MGRGRRTASRTAGSSSGATCAARSIQANRSRGTAVAAATSAAVALGTTNAEVRIARIRIVARDESSARIDSGDAAGARAWIDSGPVGFTPYTPTTAPIASTAEPAEPSRRCRRNEKAVVR